MITYDPGVPDRVAESDMVLLRELEFVPDVACDYSQHPMPSDADPHSRLLVHISKCPSCMDPARRAIFCALCVFPRLPEGIPDRVVCSCGLALPASMRWTIEAVLR